jgi:hypothetical protein
MNHLFVVFLLPKLWVAAQSMATGTIEPNISTINSLPIITPFQIPPDVLSNLGLPLVIPLIEPRPIKGSGPVKGSGRAGAKGAFPPSGFAGSRPGPPPPYEYGNFGMQGGLPYDRCKYPRKKVFVY